jgi:hypothetical protein
MPLITDRAGRYIPQGTVDRRIIDEPFFSGTLPASLTLASGSGAFKSLATTDGGYAISTAATSGSTAELKTAAGINTSSVKAILFELDGLYFSSQSVQVDVSIGASGSVGVGLRQNATDTTASLIIGGNTIPIPYQLIGGGNQAGNHRNLGLMLIPATKEIVIFESGEAKFIYKAAAFVGGAASPGIKITSRAASTQSATMLRARVTVFQN